MPTVKRNGSNIILKNGKVSCDCCQQIVCTPDGVGSSYRDIQITSSQFAELYAGGTAQCVFSMSGTGTFDRVSVCYTLTVTGTSGGTADFSMDPDICNRVSFSGFPPAKTITNSGSATGTFNRKTTPCTVPTTRSTRTYRGAFLEYSAYNSGGLYPFGARVLVLFSAGINYRIATNNADAEIATATNAQTPDSTVLLKLQSGDISVPTKTSVSQFPFVTSTASWTTYPEVNFTPFPP